MNNSASSPFTVEVHRCRLAQAAWARQSVSERVRPLAVLRRLLVTDADRICSAVEQDVGRLSIEVIATDILPTADSCKFHQKHARRILRPRRVSLWSRPLWLFGTRDTVYRRPHGVV